MSRASLPILILAALLGAAGAPAAQTWQSAPALSTPRADAAYAVLDGRLYVFGGRLSGGVPLRTAEAFDPATGWTDIAPMDDARAEAQAVAFDGQIYVIGGRRRRSNGTDEVTDDVEIYDPATNRWTEGEDLEDERVGLAAGVAGGQMFVLAGAGDTGQFVRTAERFQNGRWERYTDWQVVPGRALSGSASLGSSVVIAGGFSEAGPLARVDRYTPMQPRASMPPLPDARGALALATDGASLFAVGGRDASNARVASVHVLRADSARWASLPSLPSAREGAIAAVLGNDLYVAGGTTEFGTALSSVVRLSGVAVADEDEAPVRRGASLALASANPTRGPVRLVYALDAPGTARIEVFDIRGRRVATISEGASAPGAQRVTWDASTLPAGLYAVRLSGAFAPVTVRLAVVR